MARNSNPHVGIDIVNQMTEGAAAWGSISERYEALRHLCVDTLTPGMGHLIDEQVLHNVHNPSRPETESLSSRIKQDTLRGLVDEIAAERTLQELEAIRNGHTILTLAKNVTVIPHPATLRVIEFPNRRYIPISEQLIEQHPERTYRVDASRSYKGTMLEAHTLPALGGAVLLHLGSRNMLLFGFVGDDLNPRATIDVRTVKS